MERNWKLWDEALEIQAELARMGFNPGESFAICRYEDEHIASINDGNDGNDFSRPWGPTRYVA